MINIGIVDDQPALLSHIRYCVNKTLFSLSVDYKIMTFKSSEQVLDVLPQISFSLLLIDIELPGMNGVTLAKKVYQHSKDSIVLFLSSYDGYMKDAFGLNVYKYILKDNYEEDLHRSLTEVIHLIEGRPLKAFKTPNGVIHLYPDEIVFIEYIDRNPYIYTTKLKAIKLSSASLISIYKALDDPHYVMINSQTIVNLHHVFSVNYKFILMKGYDREFKVSRSKRSAFIEKYEAFLLDGNTL